MKLLLYVNLFSMLLLISCSLPAKDDVATFIPGIYIRFSQHEFGTEYDTFHISLQNKETKEYRILRKWKYERVLDGQKIEPKYEQRTTTGVFEPTRKLLLELGTGDSYSFDPKQKLLFNGSIKYVKL